MNAPETLDTNNTDQDTRTTPRWLRLPGLVLLAVLSGYFGVAAVSALDKDPVTIVRQNPYFFWFGTWKMFTTRERYHVSMEAEAFINGGWEPFELSELFPYRWESGERYARGVFRRHRVRMSTLGQATCGRYAAANQQDPDRIRFLEVRWRKTLGETEQPRDREHKLTIKPVMEWDCRRRYPLPEGRRL